MGAGSGLSGNAFEYQFPGIFLQAFLTVYLKIAKV